MVRRWPGRLAGLAVLVALAQSAWAGDSAVGDRVVLRVENPLGVPLHRHPRSNARFDAVLRDEAPGFRRIAPDLQCTEYFDGRCGWLDHVVVSAPMREAAEAVAIVAGHCAVLQGQDFGAEPPAAYRALSDHCPVVDIANEDLD